MNSVTTSLSEADENESKGDYKRAFYYLWLFSLEVKETGKASHVDLEVLGRFMKHSNLVLSCYACKIIHQLGVGNVMEKARKMYKTSPYRLTGNESHDMAKIICGFLIGGEMPCYILGDCYQFSDDCSYDVFKEIIEISKDEPEAYGNLIFEAVNYLTIDFNPTQRFLLNCRAKLSNLSEEEIWSSHELIIIDAAWRRWKKNNWGRVRETA